MTPGQKGQPNKQGIVFVAAWSINDIVQETARLPFALISSTGSERVGVASLLSSCRRDATL